MHKQVNDYAIDNRILPPNQSGFRKFHSTTTALLEVTDEMLRAINKSHVAILVLLDLTKAFDLVQHEILLAKLKYYSFDENSVKWFHTYLCNRNQKVSLSTQFKCKISSSSPIKARVPQGSILGPLLFSLYCADMQFVIEHSHVHYYADDTQILITAPPKEINLKVKLLNEDLHLINEWCCKNGLKINPDKCNFTLIGTKRKLNSVVPADIKINISNSPIQFSKVVKNLGVNFDEHLNWNAHISGLCSKALALLRSLYHLRSTFTEFTKLHLIKYFLFPHFDYCDAGYGPLLSLHNMTSIQRVHNASIRFVYDLKKVSTFFLT